jgi:lipopolysaccharide transport system ATP-binding protein
MLPALLVDNLVKEYRLGNSNVSTLSQAVNQVGRWTKHQLFSLFGNPPPPPKLPPAKLLALSGVSLQVRPGEVVGIVGRNGNGKSTLLKILSRITLPTRGRVEIRGSVASLLEVGTGFHPELTGRENIFLNGAILGMTRQQTRSKLDAIVAFSEVEKFLDTPVKRYSSGMYVRLAFAVAAHLEPDILLVDEVLAVGDGAFQKKCLGTMENAGTKNRTVLFVSHSLPAIRSICSRVILIDQGKVLLDGPTEEVLAKYNRLLQSPRDLANDGVSRRLLHGNGNVRVTGVTARSQNGSIAWSYAQGEDIRLQVEFEVFEPVTSLGVFLAFQSLASGETVTSVRKTVSEKELKAGTRGTIELSFPQFPLRAGDYAFTLALGDGPMEKRYDYLDHNHSLPWLNITSSERDNWNAAGYFSIAADVASSVA